LKKILTKTKYKMVWW